MACTDNGRHRGFFAPVLVSLFAVTLAVAVPARALAEVKPFSANFKARDIAVTGATLHVRTGASGPAVLMLHGFGDTGDMWQPLAEVLVKDHTVIVPDLRGMGLSSHPEGGYEKTSQARDIAPRRGPVTPRLLARTAENHAPDWCYTRPDVRGVSGQLV